MYTALDLFSLMFLTSKSENNEVLHVCTGLDGCKRAEKLLFIYDFFILNCIIREKEHILSNFTSRYINKEVSQWENSHKLMSYCDNLICRSRVFQSIHWTCCCNELDLKASVDLRYWNCKQLGYCTKFIKYS